MTSPIDEAREVRTTCPYCGVGCGVLARVAADGEVAVRGDPDHPANFGRLCSKGSALGETTGLEDRLLFPEIDGRRVEWDEALDLVASKFSQTIAEHGPDAVAIYASGQLLTEDYYVANKLMKGFVGSANIDTNSRLCMASSVAGHRRAFGSDTVPGTYEDLELADLVVLVGSNLAWCHPVLHQRLAAAKERCPEMKVVLIDPRRTMTADIADLHLPIAPDGDVALFNGLLAQLTARGLIDRAYVDAHTTGFDAALAAAGAADIDVIAAATDIEPKSLATFFGWFAATDKVVTVYSQGVNQSSIGSDKVNAIINCHLATGRIGRPGMGPFSVTGQPNAMGGREVGGMANMLAAHMDIENPTHRDRVGRFWNAPAVVDRPGLKAVDMFQAVADGRIKALWIIATNPVDSLPDGDTVEAAIKACPFVVVSDVAANTDTVRHADVKLPAAGWGEKDGTVTNSERRISRQRSFSPLPGEARPDWWIVTQVAQRMGYSEAFPYQSPADIFAEHAALSAFENGGTRDFDIGAMQDLSEAGYDSLEPFQWPAPGSHAGAAEVAQNQAGKIPPPLTPPHKGEGDTDALTPSPPPPCGEGLGVGVDHQKHLHPVALDAASKRFFAEGNFYTPDGKARFIAVASRAPARTSPEFPLVLNTGRIRDQWHTMTRTAKSARLSQHIAEPFSELHPDDAKERGIRDADIVEITSANGTILVRALLSARQRKGSIFVPMHWTDQLASSARVDRLVQPTTDPISGQPASKHVAVSAKPIFASAYGFAVLAQRPATIDADYWALARCPEGWRIELAFTGEDRDWAAFAAQLFDMSAPAETLSYQDASTGQRRFASFAGSRLAGALFVGPSPVAVSRSWAVEQLATDHSGRHQRLAVLAARPGAGAVDRGSTVCSCFGVGSRQIASAARTGCHTVEAIGAVLQAGTNCGSCRAEIRSIIEANLLEAAE